MTPPDDPGTCPPTAPRKPIPQPQRIEHALAYHRGQVARLVHEASPWAGFMGGPIRCRREAEIVDEVTAAILARSEAMLRSAGLAKERATPDDLADTLSAYLGLFDRLSVVLNRLLDASNKWKATKNGNYILDSRNGLG